MNSDAPSSHERLNRSRTLKGPYSSSLKGGEGSAQRSKVAVVAGELCAGDRSDSLVGGPANASGGRKFNGSCMAFGALPEKGGSLCSSEFLNRVNASLRSRSLIDRPSGHDGCEDEEGGSPSGDSEPAIHSDPRGGDAAFSS